MKSNLITPTTLKVCEARAERLLYLFLFVLQFLLLENFTFPSLAGLLLLSLATQAPAYTYTGWFRCCDDARVDYTSLLGLEDRRKRFSEELLDTELRDSVQLQKMYRELQRQINCWDRNKVRIPADHLLHEVYFDC